MSLLKREFLKLYFEVIKNYSKNDVLCCEVNYFIKNGVKLNLKKPVEIAEKIHWLKLFHYDERYKKFADKYEVREYVKEKVGAHILAKCFGVYTSFEDIDFAELPNSFVLKCTHGSGYNLIVKDKTKVNFKKAKLKFEKWLKINYYFKFRERVYKDVEPRIICEEFLIDDKSNELIDYKFYCSRGVPFNLVVKAKEDDSCKLAYYDMNWNKVIPEKTPQNYLKRDLKRPDNFEEMKAIASKLSSDFYFIRVDLYSVNGNIYFSELTFFPNGAMKRLMIEDMNKKLGEHVKICHLVS